MICIIRGWWRTFWFNAEYPINGHDFREVEPDVLVCETCGKKEVHWR